MWPTSLPDHWTALDILNLLFLALLVYGALGLGSTPEPERRKSKVAPRVK
jgi:hypothetical protein